MKHITAYLIEFAGFVLCFVALLAIGDPVAGALALAFLVLLVLE